MPRNMLQKYGIYSIFLLALISNGCIMEMSSDRFVRYAFLKIYFPSDDGVSDYYERKLSSWEKIRINGLFSIYDEPHEGFPFLSLRLTFQNKTNLHGFSFEPRNAQAWYKSYELTLSEISDPTVDKEKGTYFIELSFFADTSLSNSMSGYVQDSRELYELNIRIDLTRTMLFADSQVFEEIIHAYPRKPK